MKYQYQNPLKPEEVLVGLINKSGIYPSLPEEILKASKQYGFTFRLYETEKFNLDELSSFKLKHFIVCDGLDDPERVTTKYLELCDSLSSLTLAISYSSKENFDMSKSKIVLLKGKYPKINYLLPSRVEGTYSYIPTIEKLIDNSICDSVRIKYQAKRQNEDIADTLTKEYKEFFLKASSLIAEKSLFHRAPTDGFISIRSPTQGFFITSTKTNKVDLDLSRVSYVENYDSKTNTLFYSGKYLPSSDSVEASILYERLPHIRAIIHTHASELFTRNPFFSNKIAVPPMRYGEVDLGMRLVDYFESQCFPNYAIMEDHGEIFVCSDERPNDCFYSIFNIIQSEINEFELA